jgi:hypothetical protein
MDGKVRTSKIKGCPADADLCDVQVLLDRVIPFATTNRNCAKTPKSVINLYRAKRWMARTTERLLTVEIPYQFIYIDGLSLESLFFVYMVLARHCSLVGFSRCNVQTPCVLVFRQVAVVEAHYYCSLMLIAQSSTYRLNALYRSDNTVILCMDASTLGVGVSRKVMAGNNVCCIFFSETA